MSVKCTMILGDCLDVLKFLPKSSSQLCFADLPYGSTGHFWDMPIDLGVVRCGLRNVMDGRGPVLASGNEPFHRKVSDAWKKDYRYCLIWDKGVACNWLQANKRPMLTHEFIGVYGKTTTYNPIKTTSTYARSKKLEKNTSTFIAGFKHRPGFVPKPITFERNPVSILYFKRDKEVRRGYAHGKTPTHPTQKPVALLSWLIRTYSNPGDNLF